MCEQRRAVDRRAPPDPIRPARMACCIHTRAMEVTDEAVRLRLERIRGSEPRTEKHFPKALLWDIKRVHPHLLPPPSVVFCQLCRQSGLSSIDSVKIHGGYRRRPAWIVYI